MKASEMTKMLKEAGCRIERHGSSHDIWYSPITQRLFQVPRHQSKELPKGTANKIMKDAGLR